MQPWLQLIFEVYRYHAKQQEKLGISVAGNPHGQKRFWSIRDTAKIYGKSANWVHQSLIIAAFLKTNTDFKPLSRNQVWRVAKDVR